MLRGSLCRDGAKAQESCLWKPSALPTKFWMQLIVLRKWTLGCRRMARCDVSYNRGRGNHSRFDSRRGNDGGARRTVLRHAARRFWRGGDQGGAAGNRRPVARMGSAVCGQRIRLLSRGESQQTVDYSQLRSFVAIRREIVSGFAA